MLVVIAAETLPDLRGLLPPQRGVGLVLASRAVLKFFRKAPLLPPRDIEDPDVRRELNHRRWAVFMSITVGYGFYYVCRLSFSVAKKPMADAGVFDAAQLGIIGSALFFAYAFGKFANGVLADRVNIRRFMATGLFMSAGINVLLGSTTAFAAFLLLWGLNGWFQSFGAASSVVSITRWWGGHQRGTFYGMWASSHNVGEAITFVGTAFVITWLDWRWGFRVAGLSCVIISFLIYRFLFERPEAYALPRVVAPEPEEQAKLSMSRKQLQVFLRPAVWILAVSSACFYVTRYAVNSWGIFFLEAEKGYTTIEASSIVAVNAIAGIFGTFFSGLISDWFYDGKRNLLALLFGIIYAVAAAVFFWGPQDALIDSVAMGFFGVALGVLMVYLGGLMAVDICSKEVSGTVLGVVGVASYLGAGFQDIISGQLIEDSKVMVDGVAVYNFDAAIYLWVGAAVVSFVLATLVWNVRSPD